MLKMYHDTVQSTPTTNDLRLLAPIPRILVVDADDDTRELYRQSFQPSGYHVVEASDGRDALTKALVSPPNLVVTEIRLLFLDGYALCEILRRDRATADIPILVLTAARSTDMDRARRAGADIVVAKPTTPDHNVSLSRRLLDEVKTCAAMPPPSRPAPLRHPRCQKARPPILRGAAYGVGQGAFSLHHADAGNTTGLADVPVVRPPARLRPKPYRRRQRSSAGAVGLLQVPLRRFSLTSQTMTRGMRFLPCVTAKPRATPA